MLTGFPVDIDTLQFLLAIGHISAAFHHQGIAMFSQQAFTDAGYAPEVYGQFAEIIDHEGAHVQELWKRIADRGIRPVQACTYSFGFTTIQAFTSAAGLLEDASTSAYVAAIPLLSDPQYVTVAAVRSMSLSYYTETHHPTSSLSSVLKPAMPHSCRGTLTISLPGMPLLKLHSLVSALSTLYLVRYFFCVRKPNIGLKVDHVVPSRVHRQMSAL